MADVETPTEVRATAKYVRTAPRKAQLVAAEIRGRRAVEARQILAFMTRDAARDVDKVLASAIANAEANHGLSGDELYVSAAEIGSGPTLKRWRARARGRVGRIKKRTCHITIRLAPVEEAAPAPRAPAVEEKPRAQSRARRPKAEATVTTPEAPPPAVDEPAPEEKPKRAPRKKPAGPAAGPGAEAEATPKPPRPRTKPAAEAAPAAEKPKRAPRKKAEPKPEEES